LDLPEQVYNQIEVTSTPEIRRYYNKVIDGIREAGDLTMLENSFNNLRQLTSGFLGVKITDDGEEVQRDIITFDPNPKLDALAEFVSQIPLDEKIVIFNHFIYSGEQIVRRLDAEGHKCFRLYGGTPKSEKRTVVERFDRGDFRVLVVNAQSGAIGLNLQSARYCVFYEAPVSPIIRPQAEKRVHRLGQDRTVFYYDLVMRNSVDVKVLQYLREGRDLFQSLIRGEDHTVLFDKV
jgi:SNF2 family DNA or RNA helicase